MEQKKDRLFSEFPPVTTEQWEARIREDLKGADYEKKLIWKTLDGFTIKPYYRQEDLKDVPFTDIRPGQFPYVRGNKVNGNAWEIRQDFTVFDVKAAVKKAAMARENGVNAIGFDLIRKGDMYYHDFKALISDFDFKNNSIHLLGGEISPAIFDFFLKALEELNIESAGIKGSLGFDPMGQLALSGGFYYGEEEDFDRADVLLLTAINELPGFRVLPVSSCIFANAGSTAVQELGAGLAMASEYFAKLTDAGHDANDIAANLQWNLSSGSSYFMEIAKVRAARLLFARISEAYNVSKERSIYIHSVTSDWNKTIYDAHVNLLRNTTEAMAAVIGGCDSLLVKPYDEAFREPDDFSERIARNTQSILKEEAYLDKVSDPSAGSYYIESLTQSLVDHAWQFFLQIDEKGGFIKAFVSGFIANQIKAVADQRRQLVASRREILLGTNQYPNVNDQVKDKVEEEIAFPEPVSASEKIAEPLDMGRAAREFETLRLAVEKSSSPRPKVFLLPYGNLAMRLARSQFSANFFACAGYEIIDNLGYCSAEEGATMAMKAGAKIVVVCSSDEEYMEIAPEVADRVKGKAVVVVAGAPASMEELKQKGITEFIHIRSNVLDTLRQFHKKLGIEI
jgi:methylmalonyl-CoA mutase